MRTGKREIHQFLIQKTVLAVNQKPATKAPRVYAKVAQAHGTAAKLALVIAAQLKHGALQTVANVQMRPIKHFVQTVAGRGTTQTVPVLAAPARRGMPHRAVYVPIPQQQQNVLLPKANGIVKNAPVPVRKRTLPLLTGNANLNLRPKKLT